VIIRLKNTASAAHVNFTKSPTDLPSEEVSYRYSPELSLPEQKTAPPPLADTPKMSYGTNTAPTIDSHMLVQLLLCIGLPFLILPILATAAYCGFWWLKAKKKGKPIDKDVENGDLVLSATKEDSDEDKSVGSQHEMTPALVSNSVQVPVSFSRNF
jgi:hypothetical protein